MIMFTGTLLSAPLNDQRSSGGGIPGAGGPGGRNVFSIGKALVVANVCGPHRGNMVIPPVRTKITGY